MSPATPVRAGFGRREITPPLGAPHMLDLVSQVEEVWDPLYATALVLDDGATRAVVIGTDLCGILGESHREIRRAVGAAIGVEPDTVILNVSHSHCAPYVTSEMDALVARYGRAVLAPGYFESLRGAIVDAARQASEVATPARLRFGRELVERVGANRRVRGPDGSIIHRWGRAPAELRDLPEGRIDPLVAVVRIDRADDDHPIGAVFSYACHPTAATGPGCTWVSADFVGPARDALEAEMRAGPALFLQGCGGNVGTGKYVAGTYHEDIAAMGARLGDGAIRAYRSSEPVAPGPLRSASTRVPLALDPFPPLGDLEAELARRMDEDIPMAAATGDQIVFARRLDENRRVLLGGIAIGSFGLAGLPGEVFVQFGLDVQARSPFPHTIVAGYCDTALQYVPTRADFPDGSYEVDGGWRYVAPGDGELMADAAVSLLQDLRA